MINEDLIVSDEKSANELKEEMELDEFRRPDVVS